MNSLEDKSHVTLLTAPITLASYVNAQTIYRACKSWYLFPSGITSLLELPIGAEFGLVNSPSDYCQRDKIGKWLYVRFEVVEQYGRKGERAYRKCSERELEVAEKERFEGML